MEETVDAITVQNFSFAYGTGGATTNTNVNNMVLKDISFSVPQGSRVLVVGLNGTGKSTLMRCLSGKHYHIPEQISVLGKPAFFDNQLGTKMTYLGSEWRNNPVTKQDVQVERLLEGSHGFDEERRKKLVEILNIVEDGRMHLLSDGQRQSVQIAMGLMKKFNVLLMDETTVECDLLVRKRLLQFLKEESEGPNKATIMYATHVFDTISSWPTHIMHICCGRVKVFSRMEDLSEYQELLKKWDPSHGSPLCELVVRWMEEEFKEKKAQKKVEKDKTVEEQLSVNRNVGDRFYNYWG